MWEKQTSHTFSDVLGGPAVVWCGLIPWGPQTPVIQPLRCPDRITDTQTAHQAKTWFNKSKTTPRVHQFWSLHCSDNKKQIMVKPNINWTKLIFKLEIELKTIQLLIADGFPYLDWLWSLYEFKWFDSTQYSDWSRSNIKWVRGAETWDLRGCTDTFSLPPHDAVIWDCKDFPLPTVETHSQWKLPLA